MKFSSTMSERSRQRPHDALAFRLVEIERDRALAAVDRQVVAGLARVGAVLSLRNGGPQARVSSPTPGRSTLITSAPRSARIWLAHGPAMMRLRSSTRMCDSGPAISALPRFGRARRRAFGERLVPGRDLRMVLAPVEIGKPEVDVRERAADRDMADAERRRGDARRRPARACRAMASHFSLEGLEDTRARDARARARCATGSGAPAGHRRAHDGAAPSTSPSDPTGTASGRRAACRDIRRSRPSHRAACRRRAPASAACSADCRPAASLLVVFIATTVRDEREPVDQAGSCAATMTLRTNGERGDQWSFMGGCPASF